MTRVEPAPNSEHMPIDELHLIMRDYTVLEYFFLKILETLHVQMMLRTGRREKLDSVGPWSNKPQRIVATRDGATREQPPMRAATCLQVLKE